MSELSTTVHGSEVELHDDSPLADPVELTLEELREVSGGLPNGTWAAAAPNSLPNGTW